MRVIVAIILAVVLTACGATVGPSQKLVKQAIAVQVSQTQAQLSQELYRESTQPPQVKIDRIDITEREPLTIESLEAYRIRGTYDLTLNFPRRSVSQQQNPFEVYLQQPIEGDIWQLARLQPDGENWVTQQLPQ